MKKQLNQTKNKESDLFFSTFRKNVDFHKNQDHGWKSAVRNEWLFHDLVQKVWERPFSSLLEKHMALQASSILLGSNDHLRRWPIRPWRQGESVAYDTEMNRFPDHHQAKLWLTNLGQIVKIISPILHNIFIERFSVQVICKKYGISRAQLIERCQPVDFTHPLMQCSLFAKNISFLKEKNYSFVSFKGLEDKICFDYQNRTFYFDEYYFMSKPVSHFFHRLSLMIKANEQKEFIFLHLDPMNEVFPILRAISSTLITDSENEITKLLSDFEKERLLQLEVAKIKVQDVCRIWTEIWDELYKEQLSESLDLIGLVESYLNIDFFDEESLLPLNMVHKNRRVRLLLNISTVLKY